MLGKIGTFGADDVIAIIVSQPVHQRFIAHKLLEFFVYSDPEPELIEALAQAYALSGADLAKTVGTILRSNVFFSPRAYRAIPKSPIELAIGTLRYIGAGSVPPNLPYQLARMGQEPLNPPSVKGWDGGPAWINTSTLLARFNFVNALVAQTAPGKNGQPRAAGAERRARRHRPPHRDGRGEGRRGDRRRRRAGRRHLGRPRDARRVPQLADTVAPGCRTLSRSGPRTIRTRSAARSRSRSTSPSTSSTSASRNSMQRRTFVSSALSVAFLGGNASRALAQVAGGRAGAAGLRATRQRLVVVQMARRKRRAQHRRAVERRRVPPRASGDRHSGEPSAQARRPHRLQPRAQGSQRALRARKVALVQGVGYPNPNRSHFEATQIWETASPDRPQQYGWLGRYLDRRFSGGAKPASLFEAVSLGDMLPAALVASHVEVPAIGALGAFGYNTGRDLASKQSAGVLYDGAKAGQSPYLAMIAETARDAYHGGDVLRAQTAAFTNKATYASNGFAQQLALAAKMIGSSAGSKIVFVSIGSFDTHAGQRAQQDRLLGYLGDGLLSFYTDLAAHGLDRKVLDADLQRVRPPRDAERFERNRSRHGDAGVLGRRRREGRHLRRAPSLTTSITAISPSRPTFVQSTQR